ncbi:hypothetical protein LTS17_001058 [Exophiala oligosperma]
MRSVPAPGNEIAGVDGGTLWDCRLPCGLERFGPFADDDDFHRFLRNGVDEAPPGYPDITEMIQLQKQEWSSPVLTHGDLSSLNIMVHKGDITGIIDWETSGWWPPYWEYTTAHQVNPRNMFWGEHIDQFLDPWPEALKMEKIRQRWASFSQKTQVPEESDIRFYSHFVRTESSWREFSGGSIDAAMFPDFIE